MDRIEQIDRLQSGCARDDGTVPELLHDVPVVCALEIHVGRKRGRQAADFTPAHRVRLAGNGKGTHAGPADAASQQMTVDDAVDLVGAGRGLIHALREDRERLLGACE
jgi:hypothetical protein